MIRGPNASNRFGTSDVAKAHHLAKAGLFRQLPHSIYVGIFGGKPVFFHGPAGMTVTAGARAGKLRDFLVRNLVSGTCLQSLVVLDPKGEAAAVARNLTFDEKFAAHWNPLGLHGLPQDRINFLGHLTIDSPTLVSDIKVLWENLIARMGMGKDEYFVGRGREFGEGISLAVVELAEVLTFPRLYEAVTLIHSGGDQWLDFAHHMSRSRFPQVRSVEAEIAVSRDDPTGGFRGIIGELSRAVACLSDPVLMASVSPPFTLEMKDIITGDQTWQLYLMAASEYLGAWAPVIKSAFVTAMLLKSRAPDAPRVTFFLDECGQLAGESGFPLVPKLFTYGAGIGIQPVAIFQSNKQMRALGPEAEELIMSSAAAKLMFALRDMASAKDCAEMCGSQTLHYDDILEQERARYARNMALQSLISGGDILQASLGLAHHSFASGYKTEQHRQLVQPDEVMNMPGNRAIFFHEDVPYPIMLDRRRYWTSRDLAGLYHPNPYHPPLDQVTVQTRWGQRSCRVIKEPAPEHFAHYPQYRDGLWSFIEDYPPPKPEGESNG